MEREIIDDIFVFVSIIVAMGCFTGILTTFMKFRRGKSVGGAEVMEHLHEITDRLARLENSIDATALEVERISEAQRFTAKVLAERPEALRMVERKSVTPH